VTLFAFDAHTRIAYTPEKFFTCSDNAMSRLQFVENLAVYPAREFENEFRRPEKIREILK
jgi:hypothetical protein